VSVVCECVAKTFCLALTYIHTHTQSGCWPFFKKNKVTVLDVVSVEGTAWRRSSTFLQATNMLAEQTRTASNGSFLRRTSSIGNNSPPYRLAYRLPSIGNAPPLLESPSMDMFDSNMANGNQGGFLFSQFASMLAGDEVANQRMEGDAHDRMTSWGLKLGHDLVMVMETYCRMNALGFSNLLDHTLESSYKLGLQDASVNSILFTSRPLTAGATKFWLQAVFMLASLYYICAMGVSLNTYMQDTAVWPKNVFRHYRFTNLEAKNGSIPSHTGILEFGLIDDQGCPHTAKNILADPHDMIKSTSLTKGSRTYVSFDHNSTLYGWFLRVDPRNVDTAYYEIHASNKATDDPEDMAEKEWTLIGSPVWQVTSPIMMDIGVGGSVFTKKRVSLEGTTGMLIFDPRPRWQWILNRVFRPLMHAICFCTYSVLGMLRRPVTARFVMLADTVIVVAVFLVCGVGYAAIGQIGHAAEMLMYIPFSICTFYGIIVEKTLMSACLIAAVVDVFIVVFTTYALHGQPLFTFQSLALAAMYLWVVVKRWQALSESRRLVKLDQEKYDALWEAELLADEGKGCLEHLAKGMSVWRVCLCLCLYLCVCVCVCVCVCGKRSCGRMRARAAWSTWPKV
jgi:hypothetical protein